RIPHCGYRSHPAGSGVAVHGVGGPAAEAECRVHPNRRRVVLVYVEHHVGEPEAPQMSEAREGQGAPEAATLPAWVDPPHVYLADRRAAFAAILVHLRPVEARQRAV